jgi:hypothetical protein
MLLSERLADVPEGERIDAERDLMKRIASGRCRYRYFDSSDRFATNDGKPRAGHRYELLPKDFFLAGRVNWLFSAVTFADRTIQEIEIFVPNVGKARARGRPTPKSLLLGEAELRLPTWSGDTFEDFARTLRQWLSTEHPEATPVVQSTVRNILRPVWRLHKKSDA